MNFNPKTIDSLLEEKPEDREVYLDLLPPATSERMIEMWAKDDRIRITDMVYLPDKYKVPLCHQLAGNPNKGITGTNKVFFLAPNPDYVSPDSDKWPITAQTPIMLPGPSRESTRTYIKIDRPMTFPAAQAILAITLFGPKAENKHERNRLIEISAAEFGIWAAKREAELQENEAVKAAEEAEALRVAYEQKQADALRKKQAAERASLRKLEAEDTEEKGKKAKSK